MMMIMMMISDEMGIMIVEIHFHQSDRAYH